MQMPFFAPSPGSSLIMSDHCRREGGDLTSGGVLMNQLGALCQETGSSGSRCALTRSCRANCEGIAGEPEVTHRTIVQLFSRPNGLWVEKLAGATGLEPAASCVTGRHCN